MVKVNLLPIRVELRKKALVEHLILLMLCIALALIGAYFVQHAITQQREALKQEVADTKVEIRDLPPRPVRSKNSNSRSRNWNGSST